MEARSLPDAIQWHEGMLLAPQHFQQLSARQEMLVQYHLAAAMPYHWGVLKFKPDQSSLMDGIFRVLELEAVMPDGLVVHHGPQDPDLEIDLGPYAVRMKQNFMPVHLAVAARKSGASIVNGSLPRYRSVDGPETVDENSGEMEISISRLKPRLHLLITENPPKKYVSLPLATIGYTHETISLGGYVPPILSVPDNCPIGRLGSSVARKIREKALHLAEKLGASSALLSGPMVLETRFMIHSLMAGLPQFEALLNARTTHPYDLYLSLCTVLGNVSILGRGVIAPVLDPYDHNNLRDSFEAAAAFIFKVLEDGVQESHTSVPFTRKNNAFELQIRPEWLSDTLVVGFRLKPSNNHQQAFEWMREALIGSTSTLEMMQRKRILGPERKPVDTAGRLVPSREVVLFAITASAEFIKPGQVLHIANSGDPAGENGPLEILLYVENKEN